MLERLFDLKGHGTSLRTEVLAGLTTFLTMAYIVVVNPANLGAAGRQVAAVAVAMVLGQARLSDWLVYVLAALFIVRFLYLA